MHLLSTCQLYITIDALEYYGVRGISYISSALVVNQFLITNLTFYIQYPLLEIEGLVQDHMVFGIIAMPADSEDHFQKN